MQQAQWALIGVLVCMLTACGGGGGGGGSSVSPAAASAATPTISGSQMAAPTSGSTIGHSSTNTTTLAEVAPVISQAPASLVLSGAQPATFSVVASSASVTTYQWLRNGTAIPGATSAIYVVPAVQLGDSGDSYSVVVTNAGGATTSAVARLTVNSTGAQTANAARPFSDQSLWNSRPSRFTLGSLGIPADIYGAAVDSGAYSVAVAVVSPNDLPVTVNKVPNTKGIWIFDEENFAQQIVIPHWPASVTPPSGSDGEVDIVDEANNTIHSFYQLKNVAGTWQAADYSWAPLNGTGWPTPGHYNQGVRAAGVPPSAGLIRKAEIDDGQPAYRHALAMELSASALSPSTPYVFPAASADVDAAQTAKGSIPQGSLLMLPSTFDLTQIKNARLLKIVRTLQSFGAYAVDRTFGVPFFIQVESGSNYNLMPSGYDAEVIRELDLIRGALRVVSSVDEWVDANGAVFTPETRLNLLSMRGLWFLLKGPAAGTFDSWGQRLVFPDNGQLTSQGKSGNNTLHPVTWAIPQANQKYKFAVVATGGATLRIDFYRAGKGVQSTGVLGNGMSTIINWPDGADSYFTATSGPQGGGSVTATLIQQ